MVLNARRDEYNERLCVWPCTSCWWAVVSADDVFSEVPVNHRVALLDVSGEQTYPSQGQTDQFELPVVEWELRNLLRPAQEAADVISILERVPESTHESRFGLDLEGQDVFVRYAFHVVASHPTPVTQLVEQPRGPIHLTLP